MKTMIKTLFEIILFCLSGLTYVLLVHPYNPITNAIMEQFPILIFFDSKNGFIALQTFGFILFLIILIYVFIQGYECGKTKSNNNKTLSE